MNVAIMQPYLFPYIGYFQLINSVDKFVFYDDVTFIKQGWINRNYILLNNARHLFTLPIQEISSNNFINQTRVSTSANLWYKKFKKTLFHAYKNAPNFNVIMNIIEKLIELNLEKKISDLAMDSVITFSKFLEIETQFFKSSDFEFSDLEYENKSDRLIEMVKKINGNKYYNTIGGIDLYSKNYFNQFDIELVFVKPIIAEYNQNSKPFISHLSIIDILMHVDIETIREKHLKFELL